MKKLFVFLLLAGEVFSGHTQTCYPIDTSFGIGGKAIGVNNWNAYIECRNLIVQPDNKIIQLSTFFGYEFTAIRYKATGIVDSSFGQNGKASIPVGQSAFLAFGALQADGKIVMVGEFYSGSGPNKIVLVRLNGNGTLDNSFGGTGVVSPTLSSSADGASGVAIQPDGKIVVVGYSGGTCITDCNGWTFCKPFFTVMRYNSNGTIDNSFGQNGIIAIGIGSFNSGRASSVIIQPDGKIVVAGETHYYYCDSYYGGGTYSSGFFMARFTANGTPDAGFGQNGQVSDTVSMMNTTAFALQPDGKFLATGSGINGGYTIRRYNSDGSIDNGFAQNTVLNNAWIRSMVLMPNGKIVLGGGAWNYPYDFLVARLNNNGTFDSSFNLTGKLRLHVGGTSNSEDVVTGLVAQGNYIIAGGLSSFYNSGGNARTVLAVRLADSLPGVAVPITPLGPVYPCQGSSATLSTGLQGTYQWLKDGVAITGATNAVYNASTSGNFSVRVSNANGCGQSEYVTVAVEGLPVYITPYGSTNICQGDSVKLKSNENGPLQWYLNNVAISNATDTILWAKVQGNYSVKVNNSKGCGQSGPLFLSVSPSKPPISWGGAILSTSSGYSGYQWYLNGNAITGATAPTFQPVTTGLYKVSIANFNCNKVSDEFNLNCSVVSVNQPFINFGGTQLFTASGYSGYQWYLNGNAIAGANSNIYYPQQTGIFKVTVTGAIGCTIASNDFTLSCAQVAPPTPPINWNGIQFSTSSGYPHYQWYHNDTAITGAISFTYTPLATAYGRYKVEIANLFNCTKFSEERFFGPTAVITVGQTKITYYPNPVSTTFYIDVSQPAFKNMTVVLYDMNGKELLYQPLKQGQNQISVERFSSGLYHLEIRYGAEKIPMKLTVIR